MNTKAFFQACYVAVAENIVWPVILVGFLSLVRNTLLCTWPRVEKRDEKFK